MNGVTVAKLATGARHLADEFREAAEAETVERVSELLVESAALLEQIAVGFERLG